MLMCVCEIRTAVYFFFFFYQHFLEAKIKLTATEEIILVKEG